MPSTCTLRLAAPRVIFGLLLSIIFVSCASSPNDRTPSPAQLDRIVLSKEVVAYEFAHRDYRKTVYVLPAGDYEYVLETKHALYFLNKNADVGVTWPNWKLRARPNRSAPGGLMYNKEHRLWFVFTLGSTKDFDVEGTPPIRVMLEETDTLNGSPINVGGLLGRTNKNGLLVPVDAPRAVEFYGQPDNLDAVTFVMTQSSEAAKK